MDEQLESDLPSSSSTGGCPFPIVGIGASAGGLPALIRLLEQMPPAPDMALVVVLHLAPDTPSAADRVLQRATAMPVMQVVDRMPLAPNQVYVISPGRSLRMEDGHLIADEPPATPRVPITINIFLQTLAEAHGERAIGVLLSGMGSDGVAGLGAIKAHGGFAIAQLPDDAEERSMPQEAIDAGVVDVVLPAGQIAARLVDLRDAMQAMHEGGLEARVAPGPGRFDMEVHSLERLEEVLSLLYAHTGHDFRHYKQATVLRRVERRMQVCAVPDLAAYFRLLEQDAHEPETLAHELLIGVTNFFRDPDAFDALEQSILPRLFQGRAPGEPLRAWITACSTGEEAYSLAMLLAERAECVDGEPAMQIFATDIDERAIAVARAGRYPDAIAADMSPERLARYFRREDGHFRVRKLLRDHILFARHDLLHDPAFSKLDLISCRNVLIYLNREVHRQLLEVFHSALKPGGYLFLGSAESADLAPDLFAVVHGRHRIYQARPSAQTGRRLMFSVPRMDSKQRAAWPAAAGQARGDTAAPGYAELHQRTLAQLAPPSVLVDAKGNIVHAAEGAGEYLRFSGGEPSTQLLALVPADLRADLRTALFQAHKSGQVAHTGPIRYRQDGVERAVALSVLPVAGAEGAAQDLQLVRFEPADLAPAGAAPGESPEPRVRELEEALLRARRNLQQTAEQAEAVNAGLSRTNARLQASVDELREDIEEFEAHREELQSRNEELYTVNAELQARAEETAKANDDLSNLIASTDIATLFLDRGLRIQRYTPSVTRVFNIIGADVGRPLAHLAGKVDATRLLDEVAGVFASGQPIEREARSSDGSDYIVRVHPYRTAHERIEGAVLTFFDISSRRQAEKALRESEQRLALAFAALPLGLGIIDPDGATIMLNEVMRRFMPTGTMPSLDPGRVARWRAWDGAGAPVAPADFPGARALRGESVMSGMQMLYTDDEGRETWTEVRSAPLLDGEGSITGALAVVIDVDRLKRSEEEAQQNAQRQAFLLRLADALRPLCAPAEIQGEAMRLLREHLDAGWCYYVEWDEAAALGVVLRDAARAGLPSLAGTHDVSAVPEFLDIIRKEALLNVRDYANFEGLRPELRARYTALGFRSMLVATLVKQERLVASLIVGGTEVCDWSGHAEALLMEVAERTWAALERSRAEAATARAERRAESILEHMSEAHCVLGPDYRFLVVNAAAERQLGQERALLLGRSYRDVFPASADAAVGQAFRRVVEEGVDQHFTHHSMGEGHDFHLEVDAYPTEEGGVAIFWRDITERRRAAQALQASEEKYRALFTEMDEAYAVVELIADAAGRWTDFLFLDANPAFMRHTSMPYPVGKTAIQLLGTPNPHWVALYGRVVETGEPMRVEEGELMLGRVFDLNIFRLGDAGSRRVAVLFTDITERRRGEDALRASEERYRMLFDASPMPFVVTGPDAPHFTVVGVNDAYLAATMRTREALVGHHLFEAFPDDEERGISSVLRASFERVLATRRQDMMPVMKYDIAQPDGSFEERWWIPLQSPVLDDDGQVKAIIHSATDVTDIHRAGAALRASELRLAEELAKTELLQRLSTSLISEQRPEAMHEEILDAAMLLAESDAASIQFLDPITGRLRLIASRKLHPQSAEFWRDMDGGYSSTCGRAMRTHGRVAVEDTETDPEMAGSGDLEEYRRSDIRAVQSTPLRAGSGRVVGLISTHWRLPRRLTEQDFTLFDVLARQLADLVERAQTEEAMRESEARFRALAEASPALIWQLDSAGALTYANGRCQDLTGATMDQLRDAGWQSIVHADDAADYLGAIEQALHGQQAFERRVRLQSSGGGYRWFESHALPWHVADGRFRGLVGMSIDVSDAVQAEHALRTADRHKDEFLATLAHELRNPLAPISNALQFLRYPDGQRRADRLLAMVERQVRHMVRLVDDLMEVSRISRGMVELRRAPVTLAAVLESGVETSRTGFEQKHQHLTVEAADETLMLHADKVRLTQVFANLLNNASKYTAAGGRIWLGAVRSGAEVLITVRDTGMGIRPEQLPHVFEMFSQPHGRNGHTDGGLGIGLSMVRSLVELHGGTVEAHSDGPGQGSWFTVRLPLHDDPEATAHPAGEPVDAGSATLAGRRILVVDDNRDAADSLCQLLAVRGAEARAVYDGRSALDTLDGAIPDAIVLDIGMPEMDGYEVARRIRQDERAKQVRLVALSGWGQHADRQRSQASGFDHHLTKPAELDSLLAILAAP